MGRVVGPRGLHRVQCSLGTDWRCPWSKRIFFPLPRVMPHLPQWGYSDLHQLIHWCKSKQPCVGCSGPWRRVGYGGGLLPALTTLVPAPCPKLLSLPLLQPPTAPPLDVALAGQCRLPHWCCSLSRCLIQPMGASMGLPGSQGSQVYGMFATPEIWHRGHEPSQDDIWIAPPIYLEPLTGPNPEPFSASRTSVLHKAQ